VNEHAYNIISYLVGGAAEGDAGGCFLRGRKAEGKVGRVGVREDRGGETAEKGDG
jgi:hypothetical protein